MSIADQVKIKQIQEQLDEALKRIEALEQKPQRGKTRAKNE